MMKNKLSRKDIQKAVLNDTRFRELFPELQDEINQILKNPNCGCNVKHIDKFFKYKKRLLNYFSNHEVVSPQEEAEEMQNDWDVINCHVDELEEVLNAMHKRNRKQIAVARYEDQVTVIVNDLGIVF